MVWIQEKACNEIRYPERLVRRFESFLPSTKKIANSEEANASYGATNIRLKLEILIEGKFNKKEILNAVKEELDRII